MKQIAALVTILILVCTAGATETRVEALGNIENFLEDDINIINFPGTLSRYTNLMIYESGNLGDNGSAVLTYHSEDFDMNFALLLEQKLNYVIPSANSYETMTRLLIGRGNFTIYGGVAGSLGDSNSSSSNSSYVRNKGSLYLSAGLGYSTTGSIPIDCGLHMTVREVEAYYDYSSTEYDSSHTVNNTGVKLYIRSKHNVGSGILRPFLNVNYYYDDIYYDINDLNRYVKHDFSTNNYFAEFGISYETLIREKHKLWLGFIPLSLDYSTTERNYNETPQHDNYKLTDTLNDLNIFVALESRINSWLSTRIAFKSIYQYSTSETENVTDNTSSPNNAVVIKDLSVHYGLAVHYKKFTMDMAVNPDLLYNGPHFVSGRSTENMVSNISLSYQW